MVRVREARLSAAALFERPQRHRPSYSWRSAAALLTNALVRADRQPAIEELIDTYRFLRRGAARIRARYGGLYGARAFKDLVVLARDFVARQLI